MFYWRTSKLQRLKLYIYQRPGLVWKCVLFVHYPKSANTRDFVFVKNSRLDFQTRLCQKNGQITWIFQSRFLQKNQAINPSKACNQTPSLASYHLSLGFSSFVSLYNPKIQTPKLMPLLLHLPKSKTCRPNCHFPFYYCLLQLDCETWV